MNAQAAQLVCRGYARRFRQQGRAALDNAPQVEPLAVSRDRAIELLSISRTQLWRLTATNKIKVLSCGTIPISEITNYAKKL
jgi:hypothetical protein